MKHDDKTLQAAIDAAMLEIGKQVSGKNFAACPKYYRSAWPEEADDRLALAKAFLAKLPEPYPSKGETCSVCNWTNTSLFNLGEPDVPRWVCVGCCKRMFDRQPILADDGRSLTDLRADNLRLEKELAHQTDMASQATVCGPKVALDEAIRRMEEVTVEELADIIRKQWLEKGAWIEPAAQAIRASLIAAARGSEALLVTPNADKCGQKVALDEAIRRMEEVPVQDLLNILAEARGDGLYSLDRVRDRLIAASRGEAEQQPDSTDWKAKYEQAEAELAALKSSSIGIIRPLSEAGPVPDGCVRVKGYKCTENDWCLAHWEDVHDTHFADIRLPDNETPAQTVNEAADPYARLKAYAKAGARIRCWGEFDWSEWRARRDWDWCFPPEKYEVHPDDLHMVPECAPFNEQPKQQVPLGPEDVLPGAIVTNSADSWYKVKYVTAGGMRIDIQGSRLIDYEELANGWQINRSIPLTGKWDANAWEPCYKLI